MEQHIRQIREEIARRQGDKAPFLVAIDGGSAGGKSTLGAVLACRLGATLVHMDDFFLPPELRTPERYAQPGGNVHHERVLEQVLLPLKRGEDLCYRPFDCRKMALGELRRETSAPVVIVEGAYSLHPALREHYDLKVFLPVDRDTQRARILRRNGPEKLGQFLDRWIPLELAYFEAYDPASACDVVLPPLRGEA